MAFVFEFFISPGIEFQVMAPTYLMLRLTRNTYLIDDLVGWVISEYVELSGLTQFP